MKISNVDDAMKAMKMVHDKGPKIVVISSTDLGNKDHLLMLASQIQGETPMALSVISEILISLFISTYNVEHPTQ